MAHFVPQQKWNVPGGKMGAKKIAYLKRRENNLHKFMPFDRFNCFRAREFWMLGGSGERGAVGSGVWFLGWHWVPPNRRPSWEQDQQWTKGALASFRDALVLKCLLYSCHAPLGYCSRKKKQRKRSERNLAALNKNIPFFNCYIIN